MQAVIFVYATLPQKSEAPEEHVQFPEIATKKRLCCILNKPLLSQALPAVFTTIENCSHANCLIPAFKPGFGKSSQQMACVQEELIPWTKMLSTLQKRKATNRFGSQSTPQVQSNQLAWS